MIRTSEDRDTCKIDWFCRTGKISSAGTNKSIERERTWDWLTLGGGSRSFLQRGSCSAYFSIWLKYGAVLHPIKVRSLRVISIFHIPDFEWIRFVLASFYKMPNWRIPRIPFSVHQCRKNCRYVGSNLKIRSSHVSTKRVFRNNANLGICCIHVIKEVIDVFRRQAVLINYIR